ncbi:hypothetical protein [Nocardia brasiliensis]|uniref:hypothetical protein n=1 Tax=Nocardia brasiliensis TaxID=37326 RepID=UPI0024542FD6|nr:hypothetical protein [Nocardia brasiliensis]
MTEHTTEAIRYAIRLPNGQLCDDLEDRRNFPTFDRMPDGTTVYLWSSEADARGQINDLAYKMRQYGMKDAYPELAKVVEVHIQYTVRDLPQTQAEGEPGQHTWNSVDEIPVGTRFRTARMAVADFYERRENDCLHPDSGSVYSFGAFGGGRQGYIEVLP